MQRGEKTGQILDSYPDASPINHLSLVARNADNTRDDDMQSGIWKKEISSSRKRSQSRGFLKISHQTEASDFANFTNANGLGPLIRNVMCGGFFPLFFSPRAQTKLHTVALKWLATTSLHLNRNLFRLPLIFTHFKKLSPTLVESFLFSFSLAWICNHNKIYCL